MLRIGRLAVLAALLAAPLGAAGGTLPSKEEIRDRWHERLAGRHFAARVRLSYRLGADTEERLLSVWRDDAGNGERLMARFEEPARLEHFAVLFLEQPGKTNDYFVFQPALRRVRRISERTASEDIYGVDLEVLGFGVAQTVATEVLSVEEIRQAGAPVYRLVEKAITSNQRFDERITLLDPVSYLPLRVEHRRAGAVVMTALTDQVGTVQGVATPIRMRFLRPNDSEVRMSVESVDYEKPIPGAFFSTWALVNR